MCQYKDVFGKPSEGVHAPRVLGVAAVDLGLTAVAAYGVARWRGVSFWKVFLGLMVLGVVAHRVFCVETTLNNKIFGKG